MKFKVIHLRIHTKSFHHKMGAHRWNVMVEERELDILVDCGKMMSHQYDTAMKTTNVRLIQF